MGTPSHPCVFPQKVKIKLAVFAIMKHWLNYLFFSCTCWSHGCSLQNLVLKRRASGQNTWKSDTSLAVWHGTRTAAVRDLTCASLQVKFISCHYLFGFTCFLFASMKVSGVGNCHSELRETRQGVVLHSEMPRHSVLSLNFCMRLFALYCCC